jgi:tryptophanyl-tRNA synthetase
MKKQKTILSGMQPTGELHLGNYLGALKNFVALQNDYECYFFIASYHSITVDYDVQEKRKQILNLAKAYIAAGIEPKKAIIFDQVDVPEHMELNWIFNTLTPVTEAERMTQFKDKSEKNSKNINLGLLTYPILQSADILLYHATHIPVGADQVQHVELTRKIARWFNNRYTTNYFVEPEALLTPTSKIQSLQNPEKKMSKSDGPSSYVGIFDEPEVIRKKINKAVTGTGDEDEIPAGAHNLITILIELGAVDTAKKYIRDIENKEIRYGDMKKDVAQTIITYFEPIRKKYNSLTDAQVEKILQAGAKKAQKQAQKTLSEVRTIIGLK